MTDKETYEEFWDNKDHQRTMSNTESVVAHIRMELMIIIRRLRKLTILGCIMWNVKSLRDETCVESCVPDNEKEYETIYNGATFSFRTLRGEKGKEIDKVKISINKEDAVFSHTLVNGDLWWGGPNPLNLCLKLLRCIDGNHKDAFLPEQLELVYKIRKSVIAESD